VMLRALLYVVRAWPLRNRDVAKSGACHGSTVTSALYNQNFHQARPP
jgi:hypothetical protein